MSRIFGTIRQNGYVVRDLNAAMSHWIDTMGVGPFFVIQALPLNNFKYRGQPSRPNISVALAQCGAVQIELIQQNNDEPSMFLDFLKAGREGLQHVAFWTERFDADMRRYADLGFEAGQSGQSGQGGANERFVYFTAEGHPGTVIEISEISGPKGDIFRAVAAGAIDWDGRDPIRPMPAPGARRS